jgi:proline iminopeptidase
VSGLYPERGPYQTHRLKVSDLHELYVEESGNKDGVPVVFFHGGPGGGTDPMQRRFFDPKHYRVIIFDQRGAGRSSPHACLEDNTTWDLVEDAERIREHLGVERWHVFGGSWGSTLSLAYAVTHPERVLSMTLRGIFLARSHEVRWFYQEGASRIFPEAFRAYRGHIAPDERDDLLRAYHRRLTDDDPEVRLAAARAWARWEASCSRLTPEARLIDRCAEPTFALALARIEAHYFVNDAWFESDDWLLDAVERVADVPTTIVQGRYDIVCPPGTAVELAERMPQAKLQIVPDAGHASSEPGIVRGLVAATNAFRKI